MTSARAEIRAVLTLLAHERTRTEQRIGYLERWLDADRALLEDIDRRMATLARSLASVQTLRDALTGRGAVLGQRWARDFDGCRKCGTTEVKHYGHGLCMRCYWRWYARGGDVAEFLEAS